MKLKPNGLRSRKQEGSAVIVVIAILALMLMLSTANHRILKVLHGDIQLLERQQIKHLERWQPQSGAGVPSPADQVQKPEQARRLRYSETPNGPD